MSENGFPRSRLIRIVAFASGVFAFVLMVALAEVAMFFNAARWLVRSLPEGASVSIALYRFGLTIDGAFIPLAIGLSLYLPPYVGIVLGSTLVGALFRSGGTWYASSLPMAISLGLLVLGVARMSPAGPFLERYGNRIASAYACGLIILVKAGPFRFGTITRDVWDIPAGIAGALASYAVLEAARLFWSIRLAAIAYLSFALFRNAAVSAGLLPPTYYESWFNEARNSVETRLPGRTLAPCEAQGTARTDRKITIPKLCIVARDHEAQPKTTTGESR